MFTNRLLSMQKSTFAKKIILAGFLAIFLFLILPSCSLAQDRFGLQAAEDVGLASGDFRVIIVRIIQFILGFLGIIALVMVMYGGFIWMTAGGDPAKIDKAKKILVNTVIGIIIILLAFTITAFIINALRGSGVPGGGHGSGGRDDFGRWGIGVGPIESVYPSPGQVDVPINTVVVVTFKEAINSQTICGADTCDGNEMENIEICEITDVGVCVEDGEPFDIATFSDSTVHSNDDRTFTIIAASYLGFEDFRDRKFMVNLKSGIETKAEPGVSVFSNLFNSEFAWRFTTNGEMDLTPPEVKNMVGVYPYPDDEEDIYGIASQPTATRFEIIANTASIKMQIESSFSFVTTVSGGIDAVLSGSYGGQESGPVTVDIRSDNGKTATNWPDPMEGFDGGDYTGGQLVNIGPYGLVLQVEGAAQRGARWTFDVIAFEAGDKIDVLSDDVVIETYIFGVDITPANYLSEIVASSTVLEGCGPTCLKTKATGVSTRRYALEFVGIGEFIVSTTPGQDQQPSREVEGLKDAYANTIIQINFTEAINPMTIEDSIVVSRNGEIVSGYKVEISNQYRTVELVAPNQCGVNSCGDAIFCWDVDGDVSEYEVEVLSSTLTVDASDPKCSQWGGAGDGHGRCVKEIGGAQVFYSFSSDLDGIVDMSFNAFNGSFNYYRNNGRDMGIVEGPSGTGQGHSGRPYYNLNLGLVYDGSRMVGYGESIPVYGTSGFGDNFFWSFFISSEIDNVAPLVRTVLPTGDADISNPSYEVNFVFDRLMRSATLKPGWKYGDNPKDKSVRYLILQTINETATPVGYWSSKEDNDQNGDGWADDTTVILNHHDFDRYVEYGPLAGSGLQSITQNCFLPSAGPDQAAISGQECVYNGDILGGECAPVSKTNPASYGYLNCTEIEGANECEHSCKVLYYDEDDPTTDLGGSWVITKDHATSLGGSTGCCLGVCVEE